MRRTRAAIVFCLAVLAACGPSIATKAVSFSVAPEANDSTPIPVELVVVYDPALTPELLKLSAREWFESRDQLLLDHPAGLRAHLWELVPGQELPMQRLPMERDGAVAAFVYADYLVPGPHRVRIDPYSRVRLRLSTNEVLVEPVR